MPASFSQTMRALEQRDPALYWVLPPLAMAAAWLLWLFSASVDVYAPALHARLEASRMAHRIAVEEDGRIVVTHCELGRNVEQGELLVELDSTVERAQVEQQETEIASLQETIQALRHQIAVAESRRVSRARLDELATQQASVQLERAQLLTAHKQELQTIATTLSELRLNTRLEAMNANLELTGSQLDLGGAALEIERLRAASVYASVSEAATIAERKRELVEREAERQVKAAALVTAQLRIQRRRIVAPASGQLGSTTALHYGDVVKAGAVIATVVPRDDVRVIAEFSPGVAVGRIVPGQQARVRLQGFSWLEYGTLPAAVTHVASESSAGTIRVELVVRAGNTWQGPLQHGLVGSVDIRIERVSPWLLVMRSVGAALAREPGAQR